MDQVENSSSQAAGRKLSERILSASTSVLLILALIFCFTVVYQIQTKRYVSIFGCSVFRVMSDSMAPEIPVGALIISRETDIQNIQKGDIICFRSRESYMNGSVVTHRVVGIETVEGEIALRTRGDSNASEDALFVTQGNFIGKVIFCTKENSLITNAYSVLTSGIGFFTLIVIPVVVITVYILHEYLAKIQKELKEIKAQIEKENAAPLSDIKQDTHRTDGEKPD